MKRRGVKGQGRERETGRGREVDRGGKERDTVGDVHRERGRKRGEKEREREREIERGQREMVERWERQM